MDGPNSTVLAVWVKIDSKMMLGLSSLTKTWMEHLRATCMEVPCSALLPPGTLLTGVSLEPLSIKAELFMPLEPHVSFSP